jgi:predicted  nucleic acid-binding Zn-ribbon protein
MSLNEDTVNARLAQLRERIAELETENVRLAYLAAKSSAACNDARRQVAELEAQLAAALITIDRATQAAWCDGCGLPADQCRENH